MAPKFSVYVVFVGNSMTHANGALKFVAKEIIRYASRKPALAVRHDDAEEGEALETYDWVKLGKPLCEWVNVHGVEAIAKTLDKAPYHEGLRRVLVLQDDLPETPMELGDPFQVSVKAHEAWTHAATKLCKHPWEVVLLGQWPYAGLQDNTRPKFTVTQYLSHYRSVADQLGVRLADVLSAYDALSTSEPDVPLLDDDNEHPQVVTSYLMAAMVCAAVFNETFDAATHLPMWDTVCSEDRRPNEELLKRAQVIAWDATKAEARRASCRDFVFS